MRLLYLLSSLGLLALAACGGGNPPAPVASASPPATAAVAPETQTAAAPALAPAPGPAPADAVLKPLFGTWALDPSQCDSQVLKISKTRFEGPGSGCDITGFTDDGKGSYTATMACTANGTTTNERVSMRPIFAPTGEGIDLVYLDRNNLKSEVLSCGNQGGD